MSTIIQRTNPDRKMTASGERWACAACGQTYGRKDVAIVCAENDHALGLKRRRKPVPAPEELFDLRCPPCDFDAASECVRFDEKKEPVMPAEAKEKK